MSQIESAKNQDVCGCEVSCNIQGEKRSLKNAALFVALASGVLATFGMSLVMIIGMVSGKAPMPAPIPVAIMKALFGALPKPAVMIFGMLSHIGYGAVGGAIFYALFKKRALLVKWSLVWGVTLWLIMQVIVLPFIGWGAFGSNITIKIALATLVLHLIYGGLLGVFNKRLSKRFSIRF